MSDRIQEEMDELRTAAMEKLLTARVARTSFDAHGISWCLFCNRGNNQERCCGWDKSSWYLTGSRSMRNAVSTFFLEQALNEG